MAVTSDAIQTITRLTPLAEVLATIDSGVKPIIPRTVEIAAAVGRTLAADVVASSQPDAATALQDGWAIAAADTVGAGGYAPVVLSQAPQRVEAGEPMPSGTDSTAPFDAITMSKDRAEALVTVNPGDGVLPAGGDCDSSRPLRRAGEHLRITDIAALACAGCASVSLREPRIRVVPLRRSAFVAAAARLVAADIERRGGIALAHEAEDNLATTLVGDDADAVVAIGGTGSGRNDVSAQTLAREGRLTVHGMALTPGETAAFGFAGAKPVLLLPGRLDAALAVWLVAGRRILERLEAASTPVSEPVETVTLARKIVSTVGLSEVIPIRQSRGGAEPLASKYLPLSSLARSDGWILIAAESEGYPAGAQVMMRAWP